VTDLTDSSQPWVPEFPECPQPTDHRFIRTGQVAPNRPAPDHCMRCGRPEAEHHMRTVAFDLMADDDTYFVLTEALREFASRQRWEAEDDLTTAGDRTRWAGCAENALSLIEKAMSPATSAEGRVMACDDDGLFDHQVTAWTVGQLRTAFAGLPDDLPVRVIPADEPGSDAAGPDQVVISAPPWSDAGAESADEMRAKLASGELQPVHLEISGEFPSGQYYRRPGR
jgi:hypothetical protein